MSNDIRKDLKNSVGDYVHSGAKVLIGAIPGIGGALSETFDLVISSPLSKRRDEWIVRICEQLMTLEERVDGFRLENLKDNELFTTIVLNASQIAMRTHQEQKKVALCNACINTALNINIDENKQLIFLNYINELTECDLRLLYFFENPLKRFEEKGLQVNSGYLGGNISQELYRYYPDLQSEKNFINERVKYLYNNRLLDIENLNTIMSGSGIYASRLTELGQEFMRYILLNDNIRNY